MNILIITPFYSIKGREDLFHDTEVVHYFAKYWVPENDVRVLNVYPHRYNDIHYIFSKQGRNYYKNGYQYTVDNVPVFLVEVQKIPRQGGKYYSWQIYHIKKLIDKWFQKNDFIPDIIVAHVPSYAESLLPAIYGVIGRKVPAIGILHYTDIKELKRRKGLPLILDKSYETVYPRSLSIYKQASQFKIANLRKEIIQSGVPTSLSVGLRAPYKINDGLKLLYVGKLISRKHVEVIIEALNDIENKSISLQIIGDGPEKRNLQKLIQKYNLNSRVSFLGELSREDVIRHMAEANMFCMTSTNETLGLTYLEAMSVGCVPVGTKGEGIDGIIVDSYNGYLVDAVQMQTNFECKIKKYLSLSDIKRREISDNAYNTANSLDEKKCSLKYLELLKRDVNNEAENDV